MSAAKENKKYQWILKNRKLLTLTVTFISFIFIPACKDKKKNSKLDFHRSIAAAFGNHQFTPNQIKDICQDSITVLVGNSEHMGFNTKWAEGITPEQIKIQEAAEAKDAHDFHEKIIKAEKDLVSKLRENPCGDKTTRTGFVSITDAHGTGPDLSGNSSIKAGLWEWLGGKLSSKSFDSKRYVPNSDGTLKEGAANFELFMSRDASKISKVVLNKLFPGWKNPQFTFIFKMHGSALRNSDGSVFNGVLYDGYENEDKAKTNKFTPYYDGSWLFSDIDKQCANYKQGDKSSALYSFCETWADHSKEKDGSKLSQRATNRQGRTDQGRTDQGRTDQGRTDQGRTDQGRTDQGRTDQGRTDQGRTDQGLYNAALGQIMPKGLNVAFDLNTPQGMFQTTNFATYNKEKINEAAGIYKFQWPIPKYTKTVPVYTLFDSCQQSTSAYQAIGEAVNKNRSQGVFVPVIGRVSSNSVGTEELDYSALSSLQLRALPWVMFWAGSKNHPQSNPAVNTLAKKIDDAFKGVVEQPKVGAKLPVLRSKFSQFTICTKTGMCNLLQE